MILRERDGKCVLIDFGLAQVTSEIEQRGVDVHVMFQTLESTHPLPPAHSKPHLWRGIMRHLPEHLM